MQITLNILMVIGRDTIRGVFGKMCNCEIAALIMHVLRPRIRKMHFSHETRGGFTHARASLQGVSVFSDIYSFIYDKK